MKKVSTLVLGMTAVFALTACGGGSKVSEEEFTKKAAEVEEHQYSSATFTYSVEESGNAFTEDGKSQKMNGKVEFTFNDGRWTTKENDAVADDFGEILDFKVSQFAEIELMPIDEYEEYGLKVTTNYYVNPFKIDVTAKLDMNQEGVSMKMDLKETLEFEQYGFITKAYAKMTMSTSYGGESVSGTALMNLSVSYK